MPPRSAQAIRVELLAQKERLSLSHSNIKASENVKDSPTQVPLPSPAPDLAASEARIRGKLESRSAVYDLVFLGLSFQDILEKCDVEEAYLESIFRSLELNEHISTSLNHISPSKITSETPNTSTPKEPAVEPPEFFEKDPEALKTIESLKDSKEDLLQRLRKRLGMDRAKPALIPFGSHQWTKTVVIDALDSSDSESGSEIEIEIESEDSAPMPVTSVAKPLQLTTDTLQSPVGVAKSEAGNGLIEPTLTGRACASKKRPAEYDIDKVDRHKMQTTQTRNHVLISPLKSLELYRVSPLFTHGDIEKSLSRTYNAFLADPSGSRFLCSRELDGAICATKECQDIHTSDFDISTDQVVRSLVSCISEVPSLAAELKATLGKTRNSQLPIDRVLESIARVLQENPAGLFDC